METDSIVLSTVEVTETAKELHAQFSHWHDNWDELDKEARRPYIRAASLLITAKTISQRVHGK